MNKELKFLVVDDSITMRRIVLNTLKTLGFTEIVEASDGRDAYAKLYIENPNFIITDWNMPNMSGLELVTTVRNDEKFKNIPILMVTTRGMRQDILDALKAGINSYVVKPFTSSTLKEKIEQIMSRVQSDVNETSG